MTEPLTEAILKSIENFFLHKNTERDEILVNLKLMENFSDLDEENRQKLLNNISATIAKVDQWRRNPLNRFLHKKEEHILGKIKGTLEKIATRLKELKESSDSDYKKQRLMDFFLCSCNFLENRYEFIFHNRTEKLKHSLYESSHKSPHGENPPLFWYLLLAVIPFIIVMHLGPLRGGYIVKLGDGSITIELPPRRQPQKHKNARSYCPPLAQQNKYEDQLSKRFIGDIGDSSFEDILNDTELKEILLQGPRRKDASKLAFQDRKSINESNLLNYINQYQESNRDTALSNKLERIKPLIHISENNKRARSLNSSAYLVAVAVPFGFDQSNIPSPLGLGILRGADMAQKYILDGIQSEPQKAPFELVVVNDSFNENSSKSHPTRQDLSHYISAHGYKEKKVLAILGHPRQDIANIVGGCYEEYGLPVLLSSFISSNIEGKKFVQSLLPRNSDVAKKVLELFGSPPASTRSNIGSRNSLLVFFDKRDFASQELGEKICNMIKSDPSNQFKYCSQKDVSSSSFSQDLIQDTQLDSSELFLALNPLDSLLSSNNFLSRIVTDIIREYANRNKQGTIYVNHSFIDEMLVKEMNNLSRKYMQINSGNLRILRFAPWDWRAINSKPSKSWENLSRKYGRYYGNTQNWYTINSINSMLLFNTLVDLYLGNQQAVQPIATARKNLGAGMVNYTEFDFKDFLPAKVTISTKSNGLRVTGVNDVICLVNLINPEDTSICD